MQFSTQAIYWLMVSGDSYLKEYSLRKFGFKKSPEQTHTHTKNSVKVKKRPFIFR